MDCVNLLDRRKILFCCRPDHTKLFKSGNQDTPSNAPRLKAAFKLFSNRLIEVPGQFKCPVLVLAFSFACLEWHRACNRILRVAPCVADLTDKPQVKSQISARCRMYGRHWCHSARLVYVKATLCEPSQRISVYKRIQLFLGYGCVCDNKSLGPS